MDTRSSWTSTPQQDEASARVSRDVAPAASAVQPNSDRNPDALGAHASQKVCYDFIAYESDDRKKIAARPWRRRLRKVLQSACFESVISATVLLNLYLICLDTDSRADPAVADKMKWVSIVMDVIFIVFLLELGLRLLVEQREAFSNGWTLLDAAICVSGAFEYVCSLIGINIFGVSMLRILRLCRLLRLLRVLKLFGALKELKKLVQMMSSCLKTLFWSSLMLFIVMTLWACVAVEVIHPYMQELSAQGTWPDCERCSRAFSSVFMADLTLFQTVIAGDSWGVLAVPLIEAHPITAIVFAGALITLIFGVLNLIVAVVVDTFADMRAKDIVGLATDMDYEEAVEKKALHRIFKQIDEDESGNLSYEELQRGAKSVADFRHWLRVLDIDAQDLRELFAMVDADGNGEVDPHEFVDAMYRFKNAESKTAAKFVKHLVTKMDKRQAQIDERLNSMDSRAATGLFATDSVWAIGAERHQEPAAKPPCVEVRHEPNGTSSQGSGQSDSSLNFPCRGSISESAPTLSCSQPFAPCSRSTMLAGSQGLGQLALGMTRSDGSDLPVPQCMKRFDCAAAVRPVAANLDGAADAKCLLSVDEKSTVVSVDMVV